VRLKVIIVSLVGLSTVFVAWDRALAQDPKATAGREVASKSKAGEESPGKAVSLLVEQLRRYPARPSPEAKQVGLFLIDAEGGEATLIANEPDRWLIQCSSPSWSHDGKVILFDATPGTADFSLSRLKALDLNEGRLELRDLGPGNSPSFSPSDDRIVFLLNQGAVPGAAAGVWLMKANGSDRSLLGGYGRPRWSPDSRQFMMMGLGDPCEVTLIDARPEKAGVLQIPGYSIFTSPSWAGEGTIVAVIGSEVGVGDTIALIDVSEPGRGKIKEVLWKQGKGLDAKPSSPAYSPVSRRCVFIGKEEDKGRAIYSVEQGKPGPPKRLEPSGFDNLIQDPVLSPDGRYVVFTSDRKQVGRVPGERTQSVEAPALSGITIDGDLKDWPAALERHAIRNMHTFPPHNGPNGLEHAFLTTSPDLSASFSVGYDPKEQLIYLAVIVRDDKLIVGNTSSWDSDSVEVFVDGLHSETVIGFPQFANWQTEFDVADAPLLQYIGIPGKGPVYGVTRTAGEDRSPDDNPILNWGDIHKTKTRMAFKRIGDVTTYEWALQAFDHYPDKPTKLLAGVKIGFDLAVIDKDTPAQTPLAANEPEPDRAAYITWGPPIKGVFKPFNASTLGEIVLGRAPSP